MKKQGDKKSKAKYVSRTHFDSNMRYIDYKFEENKKEHEEFMKEFKEFKNFMIDKLDWIIGEIKTFREEHLILTERYVDISKKAHTHKN